MILNQLLSADGWNTNSPLDDYWYGPVGRATTAGVAVDESTGLNYSACWAATRLLSGAGAGLPFPLYEIEPDGGRSIAYQHPVHKLLNYQFNPLVSAVMGRAAGINQQVNWGNFCAEIEWDGRGNPVNLWPIHASRVKFYYDADGSFFYRVNNRDGTTTDLEPQDVFHPPSMMTDDGIVGKGVIRHARETIGHGLATERYGAAWFGSGGRPAGVLTHPKTMDKPGRDNVRREWNEIYGGPGNTHKIAVMWEGMKYEGISSSPEDSQFLGSRQFNIEEIARWYGVPPHLIGHLERATNNNIEAQGIEFVKYGLMHWLVLWECEVNRKLLKPQERGRFYARHNCDELMRGDLSSRTAAYAQQFFNGALTLNQWAEIEHRDPIGPLGDIHFIQSAMIPLKDAAEGRPLPVAPKPANDPKSADDNIDPKDEGDSSDIKGDGKLSAAMQTATLEVLAEIVGVMVEREASEAIRAAKKPKEFLAWLDAFYAEHSTRLQKALAKPVRACVLAAGKPLVIEDVLRAAITQHIDHGRELLLEASSVQAEQLSASVESCVKKWQRTEITNLFQGV